MQHDRTYETRCLPTIAGLLLGLCLNIFALPIVWIWGSEDHRVDRVLGFVLGLFVSSVIVAFLFAD